MANRPLSAPVRVLVLVLVAAVASACGAKSESTPPQGSGSAPPKAEPADPCDAIRGRFNATHAARKDTCTTDTDCACYNPVGGPQLGCGGVTDAATAAKLAEIEKEFHAARCAWTHQCGARVCTPKCNAGRCG